MQGSEEREGSHLEAAKDGNADAGPDADEDDMARASEGGRSGPSSRRLTSNNSFTRRMSSSFNYSTPGGSFHLSDHQ